MASPRTASVADQTSLRESVEAHERPRVEKVTTMASKKRRPGIEWVGGLVSMPAYVTCEGAPYRPEALFWMNAEGAVLGHAAGRPGELIGLASESLRSTIERPMVGQPHAPQRVRVASHDLAEALRAGHAGLEVVCASTPEIDAVLVAMREKKMDSTWTRKRASRHGCASCSRSRYPLRSACRCLAHPRAPPTRPSCAQAAEPA